MSMRVIHKSGTRCCRRMAGYTNRHYPISETDDSQVTCINCLRELLKQRSKQAVINLLWEKQKRTGNVVFGKHKILVMVNRAEKIGNLWPKEK